MHFDTLFFKLNIPLFQHSNYSGGAKPQLGPSDYNYEPV